MTSRRRLLASAAALAVSASVLAACGTPSDKPGSAGCPDILLERSTADLVAFRPGPGRDLTDVMYEAQVTGYTGDCLRAKGGDTVTVDLQPTFTISRGPAWPGGTHEVSYFVAIPAFYPSPAGKQVFSIPFTFTSGTMTSVILRDEKVTLEIPVPEGQSKAPPVYVGFQLTPDQLEFNRRAGQ